MTPRAVWPVLVNQAKAQCESAQADLRQARAQVGQLQAQRARLLGLHEDYLQRSRSVGRASQHMADTQNLHAFMQQLQALVGRIDIDLKQALQRCEALKLALQAAEKKRIQRETLMEQSLQRAREQSRQREQRATDALGVMLHNLKR